MRTVLIVLFDGVQSLDIVSTMRARSRFILTGS
jgi:hypothetical protein